MAEWNGITSKSARVDGKNVIASSFQIASIVERISSVLALQVNQDQFAYIVAAISVESAFFYNATASKTISGLGQFSSQTLAEVERLSTKKGTPIDTADYNDNIDKQIEVMGFWSKLCLEKAQKFKADGKLTEYSNEDVAYALHHTSIYASADDLGLFLNGTANNQFKDPVGKISTYFRSNLDAARKLSSEDYSILKIQQSISEKMAIKNGSAIEKEFSKAGAVLSLLIKDKKLTADQLDNLVDKIRFGEKNPIPETDDYYKLLKTNFNQTESNNPDAFFEYFDESGVLQHKAIYSYTDGSVVAIDSNGFVAQISVKTNHPKPQTDLSHTHRLRRTQLGEAI